MITSAEPFTPRSRDAWYPEALVPLLGHPRVVAAGAGVARSLSALQLLGYLRFTVELESGPVRRVMARLCDADYLPERSDWLKSEARCIADEEIAHEQIHREALAHFTVLTRVELNAGVVVPEVAPAFLSRLEGLSQGHSSAERDFIELLFVCISETLITSELRSIARDAQVNGQVRALARAHADDESRHSAYFHRFFAECWQGFGSEQRRLGARLLPQLLRAYLDPDRELMLSNLRDSGANVEEPEGVLNEVCEARAVRERMLRAAKPTLRMFKLASVPMGGW